MNISGTDYQLIKISHGCPEQYDVKRDDEVVGYLRLRHGRFTVEYPDCGGKELLSCRPKGDGWFEEDEREAYLMQAVTFD